MSIRQPNKQTTLWLFSLSNNQQRHCPLLLDLSSPEKKGTILCTLSFWQPVTGKLIFQVSTPKMFYWSRIRYSKLQTLLLNQCKRRYSQIPLGFIPSNHINNAFTRVRVLDKPNNHFNQLNRNDLYATTVRFFAAPSQYIKPKADSKDQKGLRLNEQITCQFIRLVTDDGHTVVSRGEALDRAKKLDLDLVEVDRAAKPPVCKLMDYNRERYKKQLKEKERVKNKPERLKGDCKEVRFTGKTEQKDLKMKANTAKRMMEKGYTVKCVCLGSGVVGEDLGGVLSRISAYIEDVAYIESGPTKVLEKKPNGDVVEKQAFLIARHVKFGLPKKGGKKAAKVGEAAGVETREAVNTISGSIKSPLQGKQDWEDTESGSEENFDDQAETPVEMFGKKAKGNKTTWSAIDVSDDFEKVFKFDDNSGTSASIPVSKTDYEIDTLGHRENVAKTPILNTGPVVGSTVAKPPFTRGSSHEETKNIERNEARNKFQPTLSAEKTFGGTNKFSNPAHGNDFNRPPAATNFTRVGQNQGRQPQKDVNSSFSREPLRTETSSFRNLAQPNRNEALKQGPSQSQAPTQPSYGIFSAPKHALPSERTAGTDVGTDKGRILVDPSRRPNTSNVGNPHNPQSDSQRAESENTRQGKFGIFSK